MFCVLTSKERWKVGFTWNLGGGLSFIKGSPNGGNKFLKKERHPLHTSQDKNRTFYPWPPHWNGRRNSIAGPQKKSSSLVKIT